MTLCSRFTEQKLSPRLGQQVVPKLAAESRVDDADRLAQLKTCIKHVYNKKHVYTVH